MEVEEMGASSSLLVGRNSQSLSRFGVPWPEMNDGLFYADTVKPGDSGMSLIEFYSSKYRDSAPKEGWVQRIRNGQIKVDGQVVTNSDTILRLGSNLLYHRLPWKEPDVPYMVEVLFEDDYVVSQSDFPKSGSSRMMVPARITIGLLLIVEAAVVHVAACLDQRKHSFGSLLSTAIWFRSVYRCFSYIESDAEQDLTCQVPGSSSPPQVPPLRFSVDHESSTVESLADLVHSRDHEETTSMRV